MQYRDHQTQIPPEFDLEQIDQVNLACYHFGRHVGHVEEFQRSTRRLNRMFWWLVAAIVLLVVVVAGFVQAG